VRLPGDCRHGKRSNPSSALALRFFRGTSSNAEFNGGPRAYERAGDRRGKGKRKGRKEARQEKPSAPFNVTGQGAGGRDGSGYGGMRSWP